MEENSSSGLPKETDLQVYALSGKIMLYSVVALTLVLLLVLCFHFYARRRRYAAASSNRHRHVTTIFRRGLDPSVLKSIPTFSFSSVSHPPEADCAVCLSQFEQSDTGRVLPDCAHFFHTDCIDTWFRSHSNCPLCRAPVRSSRKLKTSEIVIEIGEYCSRNEIGVSGECGCSVMAGILMPVESGKMKSVNLPAGTWVGSGEGGSV